MRRGLVELERLELDVLLTELDLEDGSGLALVERATELVPKPRALLMGSRIAPDERTRAWLLGALRILDKPFPMAELTAALVHALVAHEPRSPARPLVDALARLHHHALSAKLVVGGASGGTLHVQSGEIVHATRAGEQGLTALRALLTSTATFTLEPFDGSRRTIESPFLQLVRDLEGWRPP